MDRAWFRPVAEGNAIAVRTAFIGAIAAVLAVGGIVGASEGREVFPAASRPIQVPSPGRTGGGDCAAELMTPEREQECAPRSIGGVYCAGQTGLAWDWVNGGVLTFLTCDGVRVVSWAFTPSPAAVAAPVESEPWEASWPEGQWENVRAVDACESASGTHPDTYRTDLIHGGRLQIARGVWAEFFDREYGWSWEQVVRDDETNFAAAYVIWQRAGGWGPWPWCGWGLK